MWYLPKSFKNYGIDRALPVSVWISIWKLVNTVTVSLLPQCLTRGISTTPVLIFRWFKRARAKFDQVFLLRQGGTHQEGVSGDQAP